MILAGKYVCIYYHEICNCLSETSSGKFFKIIYSKDDIRTIKSIFEHLQDLKCRNHEVKSIYGYFAGFFLFFLFVVATRVSRMGWRVGEIPR